MRIIRQLLSKHSMGYSQQQLVDNPRNPHKQRRELWSVRVNRPSKERELQIKPQLRDVLKEWGISAPTEGSSPDVRSGILKKLVSDSICAETAKPRHLYPISGEGYPRYVGTCYLDRTGMIRLTLPYHDEGTQFADGLAALFRNGKGVGFINQTGELAVACCFDEALPYSDGLAAVRCGNTWGYVDREGSIVIPPTYSRATCFHNGRAVVLNGSGWCLIDKAGRRVGSAVWNSQPNLNGLPIPIEVNGLWGFIDWNGQVTVPPQYEKAASFSEGFAVVKQAGKFGLIRESGEISVEPTFEFLDAVREGCAAFGIGVDQTQSDCWPRDWGFISGVGEVRIPPEFGSAGRFSEGLAKVYSRSHEQDVYIDAAGKVVVVPEHRCSPEPFQGGVAVVRSTECGLIDRSGKLIVRPYFRSIGTFSEGIARVTACTSSSYSTGNREVYNSDYYEGYIDTKGGYVHDLVHVDSTQSSREHTWSAMGYQDASGYANEWD